MKMGLLNLTIDERKNLLGPTVIGSLFGAFVAFAVFAFTMEYQSTGDSSTVFWGAAVDSGIAFVACFAGTVGILGVVPFAIGRLFSRKKGDA